MWPEQLSAILHWYIYNSSTVIEINKLSRLDSIHLNINTRFLEKEILRVQAMRFNNIIMTEYCGHWNF
jgi:hypothetical protein